MVQTWFRLCAALTEHQARADQPVVVFGVLIGQRTRYTADEKHQVRENFRSFVCLDQFRDGVFTSDVHASIVIDEDLAETAANAHDRCP